MQQFEQKKRQFKPSKKKCAFDFFTEMFEHLDECGYESDDSLGDLVAAYNDQEGIDPTDEIKTNKTKQHLWIPRAKMLKFFEPVLHKTCVKVTELLMRAKWECLKKIIIAGGSSSSQRTAQENMDAALKVKIVELQGVLTSNPVEDQGESKQCETGSAAWDGLVGRVQEEATGSVASAVVNLANELNSEVQYIVIVGGFGASAILQERIKAEFATPGGLQVIVPTNPPPQAAISIGAVLYGMYESVLAIRRSRYTYGIEVVGNVFSKFVSFNQEIAFDDEVKNVYYPNGAEHKASHINVYRTLAPNPSSTLDPGVEKIGGFSVAHKSKSENGGTLVSLAVTMMFGKTNLKCTVNKSDGTPSENLDLSIDE